MRRIPFRRGSFQSMRAKLSATPLFSITSRKGRKQLEDQQNSL